MWRGDEKKIPYKFLKNWPTYLCLGKRIRNIELLDSVVGKRSIPTFYNIRITFINSIVIDLLGTLSENDAKWTLRNKLQEEIEKRKLDLSNELSLRRRERKKSRKELMTQIIEYKEGNRTVKMPGLPMMENLPDRQTMTSQVTDSTDRDFSSIMKDVESKQDEELPEELHRFADILDED